MSAEDNSSADQADIGEALVAALGFEPAEGRKIGKKANGFSDASGDQIDLGITAEASAEQASADASAGPAAADETLSVVSPENQSGAVAEKTAQTKSNTGGPSNGATKNRSGGGGSRRNRNRNRSRNNSSQNGQQKPSSDSKPDSETADGRKDLKSAAKPTVSGGSGEDDGAPAAEEQSPAADGALDGKSSGTPAGDGAGSETDVGQGSNGQESPMASSAAVTGEMKTVPELAGQLQIPPPPTASELIKADETPAAPTAPAKSGTADAPPTAPVEIDADGRIVPVEDPDKTVRAERMAHAAKAKVETTVDARVDLPADTPPLVDAPPTKPPVAPTEEIAVVEAAAAASATAAASSRLEALTRSGPPDLSQVRNLLRRKRRVQARKVRRVVRHIDPWSVLTFSVLFHLSVFAALLLASVLVWNAAEAAGTIENLETFILELGDYETFEIKGDVVFRAAVAIAGVLTLASSVMLVLLTVVFNLISDLVGGIRLTVIEEETVRVRRRKKSS